MKTKKNLRKEIIAKRNSFSLEEIKNCSEKIFKELYALSFYQQSNNIMTYVSIDKEIYTHSFIKKVIGEKKLIFIPVTKPGTREIVLSKLIDFDKDLEKGHWGLLEPKADSFRPHSREVLELIIVPGLGFTKEGYRLGYGGGYYDNFLSSLDRKVTTISLAMEFQIIDSIPIEAFDIPVDYILTPQRLIDCKIKKEG